ncbi:TniQ family protein [Rhizobium sp. NIBRBAC000502774]|nr:TniQ family protein [Rhizobium sp. NIBRBAC000502774]
MGLFKVPLMADESLTSFTARFANANARSAKEFCADFGFLFRQVISGEDRAIDKLCHLSGIEHDRLDRAAIKRSGEKTIWVAGDATPFLFHMRGVMKFCPSCFAMDEQRQDIKPKSRKYIRKLWHSRFIRTCPIHLQSMVSAGTHGHPDHIHDICWSLDYLRRDVALAARQSVPQPFTPFEQYVLARLNFQKPGNSFLDPLPLYVAGDICELAGMVALHGKAVSIADKSEHERWEAASKGFDILSSGLSGFHEFLGQLARQRAVKRASTGGYELFGKFHEALTNGRRDPAYDPVRDAARSFAFASLPLTDGTILFGKGGDSKFVSFSFLEKKYRVSEPILRKYFRTTGTTATLPGTNIAAIPSEDVDRLVEKMKDLIRGAEASKVLGVTVSAFDLLVASGIVPTEVAKDENVGFSARYSRTALIELRQALLARATTQELDRLVPIKFASRSLLTTLVSILRLLMNGDLKSVGVDTTVTGIMSIMVDRDEVASFILPAKLTAADENGFDAPELSVRLRLSETTVYKLLKSGRIEPTIRIHPLNNQRQRIASAEATRAFHDRYMSLSECCDRSGLSQAVVRKILAAADVPRAFPREELREGIYHRAQAEPALSDIMMRAV